jgi:hypothetical protein
LFHSARFHCNWEIKLLGYGALVNTLAQGLDIKLAHKVTKVEYNSDGDSVDVVTNRGTFRADKVLVTVPLGVLKAGAIEFNPPLPENKQLGICCDVMKFYRSSNQTSRIWTFEQTSIIFFPCFLG